MNFNTKEELLLFLSNYEKIGLGSQVICYYDNVNNKVYKLFHQFFDDCLCDELCVNYCENEIMRFSNITNDTFIWSEDVVYVDNEVVGYVTYYFKGQSLHLIDPLNVNLDDFISSVNKVDDDIRTISDFGVRAYDMRYNILYDFDKIKVIDHLDYDFSNVSYNQLYGLNSDDFNLSIMYFLIDNYFDEFILGYDELRKMYAKKGINLCEFLILFKQYVSDYVGCDIKYLKDASSCLNSRKRLEYKYDRESII